MKNIEFSLKENATDSLIHGIGHYLASDDQTDLKYAVLHIAQAVELFLKEKLSREHYLLVFAKPEKADEQSKTVTFDECIQRLSAAKIEFDKNEVDAFRKLQKYRNQIQHFKIKLSREDVTNEIGRALKYLEIFLNNELNIIVKDEIGEKLYTTYCDTVYSYDELLEKAIEEIESYIPSDKDSIHYETDWCPKCGNETIVFPDTRDNNHNTVKCFFCKEIFEVKECGRCGSLIYGETEESVCDSCWEDIMTSN